MSQTEIAFDIYNPRCLKCNSARIFSLGKHGNRRKYSCRDCQCSFLGEEYTREIKHSKFNTKNPKCVFCKSLDIKKHGFIHGKQRYLCNSCERHFSAESVDLKKDKKLFNPLDPKCVYCNGNNLKKKGVTATTNKQIYYCKDCSRKFVGGQVQREQKILAFQGLNCPKCNSLNIRLYGKEKTTNKQKYKCQNCGKYFVKSSRKSSKDCLPENISIEEMFGYDTWDVRVLGLEPCTNGGYTLNFGKINPQWLKNAVKAWIKFKSSCSSASNLTGYMIGFRHFSKCITKISPFISPQDIDREVIVQYLDYLKSLSLSPGTRISYTGTIKHFLEDCARFEWADITKQPLIYSEDYPKLPKSLPRYIPDNILAQVKNNYGLLPDTVVCMIEVLLGTGIRTSELVALKINCLQQDNTGDYWIKIYQLKMKKEISLIISKDLAQFIQKQQEFIKVNLGNDWEYLFCETKYAYRNKESSENLDFFEAVPKKLKTNTVRNYLHRFAEVIDIRDEDNHIFPLGKLHQFRHTHATELINNGVPQHVVQRRLGHDSPRMTSVYAHIHDETMKQEMEKYWDGRLVNNQGQVIVSANPELDTVDMQWIKKNMKVQTLADGFCGLPITKNCPIQGSPCLSCSHFRTSVEFLESHKKRLEDTKKIIENARANGWTRQIETNMPIANNLKKIIRGLEEKEVIFGDEQFPITNQTKGEQDSA